MIKKYFFFLICMLVAYVSACDSDSHSSQTLTASIVGKLVRYDSSSVIDSAGLDDQFIHSVFGDSTISIIPIGITLNENHRAALDYASYHPYELGLESALSNTETGVVGNRRYILIGDDAYADTLWLNIIDESKLEIDLYRYRLARLFGFPGSQSYLITTVAGQGHLDPTELRSNLHNGDSLSLWNATITYQ